MPGGGGVAAEGDPIPRRRSRARSRDSGRRHADVPSECADVSRKSLLAELRVEPGSDPRLAERDPGERVGAPDKKEGVARLEELVEQLGMLHNRLYAESTRSVLLVLQGMDASGKDGTIRSVFTGVNPQGCRVAVVQGAERDRARARLPLARPRRSAPPAARS